MPLLVARVLDLVGDAVDRLTDLPLRLAESFPELSGAALGAPLGLEFRIVHELAGLFLDVALRLLGLATDLVAIHARLPFRTANREKKGAVQKKRSARPMPAAVFVPFRYTCKR